MAGQADGSIIIDTELSSEGFKAGSAELKAAIKSLSSTVKGLQKQMQKVGEQKYASDEFVQIQQDISQAEKYLDKYNQKLAKLSEKGKVDTPEWKALKDDIQAATAELDRLKQRKAEMESSGEAYISGTDTEKYQSMYAALVSAQQKMVEMQSELDRINSKWAQMPTLSGYIKTAFQNVGNTIRSVFSGVGKVITHPLQSADRLLGSMVQKAGRFVSTIAKFSAKTLVSGIKSAASSMASMVKHSRSMKGQFGGLISGAKSFAMSLLGARGVCALLRKAVSAYMSENQQLSSTLSACWSGIGNALGPIIEKLISLVATAVAYATQDKVSSDLTILADAIEAEVTRSTTADEDFSGRLSITESAITTEVSRAKGQEDALSSQIKQAADKIELKVSKGDISSQISVETGTVTIGSNRLIIESDNFKLSQKGKVTANGSITSEGTYYSTKLDDGGITMYSNGSKAGHLRCDEYAWGDDEFGQVVALQTDLDGLTIGSSYEYSFVYNNGLNTWGYNERFYLGDDLHVDGKIHTSDQIQFYGDPTWDNHWGAYLSGTYSSQGAEGVYVCGYLWVTEYLRVVGTKTRVVDTETYGMVCLNAMESADAVFSDFGSGTLDDTGVAYIYFDQVFIETVDLLHDYYVLTTQTSEKQIAYVEKQSDYFIVHGTPGASFDWIVYAYQRGYTTERLESDSTVEVGKDRADTSTFRGDNKAAIASENYMAEFKDTYDEQATAYLENYEQEVTDYDN